MKNCSVQIHPNESVSDDKEESSIAAQFYWSTKSQIHHINCAEFSCFSAPTKNDIFYYMRCFSKFAAFAENFVKQGVVARTMNKFSVERGGQISARTPKGMDAFNGLML